MPRSADAGRHGGLKGAMDVSWIRSPTGRRVLEHWADPRPAWLWSADGQALLWRNLAARLFPGKARKRAPAVADTVPIRGQIARLIRLGALDRTSLSRMQFIAGERPVSATCSCTPLTMADGEMALLVVNVDPISPDMLGPMPAHDGALEGLFPPGADYLLIDDDGHFAGGSARAMARYAPALESEGLPPLDDEGAGTLPVGDEAIGFVRFKASPQDASLLLFEPSMHAAVPAEAPTELPVAIAEPLLPMGLPPLLPETMLPETVEHRREPPDVLPAGGGLTSLFDRLLGDGALFTPLEPEETELAPEATAAPVLESVGIAESNAEAAEATDETVAPAPVTAAASETAEQPGEPAAAAAELHVPTESEDETRAEAKPLAEEAGTDAEVEVFAEHLTPGEPLDDESPLAQPVVTEIAAMGTTLAGVDSSGTADEPLPTMAPATGEADEAPAPVLYRVVGRLFTPIALPATAGSAAAELADGGIEAPVDGDADAARAEIAAALDADIPRAETPAPVPEATMADAPAQADDTAVVATGENPADLPAILEIEPENPTSAGDDTAATEAPDTAAPDASAADAAAPADTESLERVSRYNFDELSRILNDRVGNGEAASGGESAALPFVPAAFPGVPSATPEGALVTLGGETLVLNRLPLGILVFRDQQVLFANRAITEMTGYASVEGLRTAGLAAIFPAAGDEAQEAGPVNHLVRRDGALLPVTARLQSVSWRGKPALMLSASATEVRTGHEAAVRAFAETLAATHADGFIEASRAGVLTQASATAGLILKRSEEQLIGRSLSALVAANQLPALREFFERPARFAETARPAITVTATEPGVEIVLFAQGQAGIVSNYFGFVRRMGGRAMPMLAAPSGDADPGLLARLSRGVRRPLNTVIGFSDLIGSAAFGPVDNQRYLEYARDIKAAGLEIAALVDELDDFARLRDGRYTARPSDIDLVALLESSVARVRGEANAARVLVRSAISETLPRVRADRASLAQAILNLLASAIDQTPQDGSVVLSAQVDDAGGIAINVRDSAQNLSDLGERFVVFRDGVGRDGQLQVPARSSVGLALTRALLAVNQATLSVDPAAGAGTLFSLIIPPENVVQAREIPAKPTA